MGRNREFVESREVYGTDQNTARTHQCLQFFTVVTFRGETLHPNWTGGHHLGQTPVGRRKYAMLLLLARLDLRGGEVLRLTL